MDRAAEKQEKQANPLVGTLLPEVAHRPGPGPAKISASPINCPAKVHILKKHPSGKGHIEKSPMSVIAHNISRSGLGFLTQLAIRPGEQVRVYLKGAGSLGRTKEGLAMRLPRIR